MRKMILGLLLLLLTSLFIGATAQVVVKGLVKDAKGNAVAGASIAIKDSYDGGTTDSTGKYSFKTFEKGDQLLVITSIGYRLFEQPIKLDGTPLTINATLKEEISELSAVVISAGTFEAS